LKGDVEMDNLIIMHVNYMEGDYGQPVDLDRVCEKAVNLGYDGVEFRRKLQNMSNSEYLEKLVKAVEKAKLKYVLFGGPGPNLMDENVENRKREVEDAIDFYKKASRYFNLTVCNTMTGPLLNPEASYYQYEKNGSAFAKEKHWEWAVEGFKILGDVAEELKFYFAFETHPCYLHDKVESTKKLVDLINKKNVGINLDYENIACEKDPLPLGEAVKRCEDRLYYVHLKNHFKIEGLEYRNFIVCSLSDGIIDNRKFIKLLKDRNYKGPICIEAPRSGDREYFAKEDILYLKSLLSEI